MNCISFFLFHELLFLINSVPLFCKKLDEKGLQYA